jgi:predicted Fe-Mo cluster-binding NifX family protein
MMSENRAEGQMSSHFGKAEWVMVVDTDNPVSTFVKNDSKTCKRVLDIALQHGCTDVILADIGDGALGRLQAAHIRALTTPAPIPGDEALRMFKDGQLQPVPTALAATRHGEGQGGCCTNRNGAEASACCRN